MPEDTGRGSRPAVDLAVVAAGWRLPLRVLATLGWLAAALLTWLVLDGEHLRRINAWDTRAHDLGARHHGLLRALQQTGSAASLVAVTAVLTGLALRGRRRRLALVALLSPSLAAAVTEGLLKPLVSWQAPAPSGYPSGHVTTASALAVVASLLILGQERAPLVTRLLIVLVVGMTAVGSGLAVVALFAHDTASAVGGATVGISVVLTVAIAVDSVGTRRSQRRRS